MSSASPRSTADGAAELLRQLPDVDILVNNLGIFGAVPVREITNEQWRTYFEVNVLAAARLIRMYLPEMTERGWGRAIQIASDSALVIPEEMIHYGVPKTALLALSCGFAKDAAGTGITVNSVIAGPTHTAGVEDFVHQLLEGDDKSVPWDEVQRAFMRKYRPKSPTCSHIWLRRSPRLDRALGGVHRSARNGEAHQHEREQEPSGALPRGPRALFLPHPVGLDERADPAGQQDRRDERRGQHRVACGECVHREDDARHRDHSADIHCGLVESAGPVEPLLNVVSHGKAPW
jgi:NAD(P)-dependent dehydrogenase (short-subunit alcohol dehydrogenase family)